MSADVFMQAVPETQKPSSLYAYPVTVYVQKAQTNDGEIHQIYGPAGVTPSSDLASAPDFSTFTQPGHFWVKSGGAPVFGATAGTWVDHS
jgi:hypothetical protein